jgi:hypothetical protein
MNDDRARRIAEIEAVLRQPLPTTVSQLLERELAELRAEEVSTSSTDIPAPLPRAVQVGGDAQIAGVVVGVNLGWIIYGRDPCEDEQRQLVWYLQTLAAKLYHLPLRGLDERLDRGDGLALPRIYVALATTAKRPAAQAVRAEAYLVLLGEPGSGKSTFQGCTTGRLLRALVYRGRVGGRCGLWGRL